MSERRYDAATLERGMRLDHRGVVEVPAFVSRTGVLPYRRADGSIVRELRHPDDVFHADSLATLRGAPVTVDHPGGGMEWVTPANADKHEIGVCAESGKPHGAYVDALLTVRRADAIRRVKDKQLVECSAAYDCKVVAESGVYEGQPYDQRQTKIVYNHVALLEAGKGRAGSDVRLRADSADAVLDDSALPPPIPGADPAPVKETPMATIKKRVDGVDYELPETAASMVDKLIGERDTEKKRADKAESERDVMKTDLDKARDPKALTAKITARVALERAAASVLGEEEAKRFDGMTDREVQEAVLKATRPEYKLVGRSDDAITAAFDYALESNGETNHGLRLVGAGLEHGDKKPPPKKGDEQRADHGRDLDKELAELETQRESAWKGAAK